MRVWDLVGFDFGLEVGGIAGGGNYCVSFCGEGLDELVLEAVRVRFISWGGDALMKGKVLYTYPNSA